MIAAVLLAGVQVVWATPSIGLSTGAVSGVSLQVDASGDALVTWSQAGKKETALVSHTGLVTHGAALPSPDVSKPAAAGGLPSVETVRTAGGSLWAVQLLGVGAGKPPSLDLSHWTGAPTGLTLKSDGTRLTGSVTFDGKPVTGFRPTPAGLKQKIYVYLDCFGCPGSSGWSFMLGVAPKADGTFSVYLRSAWKGSRYRGAVGGPNHGTVYAPDAQTMISV